MGYMPIGSRTYHTHHMHAVGVREGAKHPILGRLSLRVPPAHKERRLKSRAPSERRVHSTRFSDFSAFPDSPSLLIGSNAFIKSSSSFPYLNIKFYRLKVFIYISLLCS